MSDDLSGASWEEENLPFDMTTGEYDRGPLRPAPEPDPEEWDDEPEHGYNAECLCAYCSRIRYEDDSRFIQR